MIENPYKSLPYSAFWRRAVADLPYAEVAPIRPTNLQINRETKIATAGSCFAQHVARHLDQSGYCHHVTERAPKLISEAIARQFGYGTFSARFGNIYTTRQLVQLFDRAYGTFCPIEKCWAFGNGFVDPFRPVVQPAPFSSDFELMADREAHFFAVRQMFETLDVFIFTLGLTETFVHIDDGAAFPLCPGTSAGDFNPDKHAFLRMSVSDIESDLDGFVSRLNSVNAAAQIILTVSPVPLVATMSGDHVLSATSYSKAVLRVAAETTAERHSNVQYFPSYEIITGAHSRGRYFSDDLRSVQDVGIAHVMRVFFETFATGQFLEPATTNEAPRRSLSSMVDIVCDEVMLEQQIKFAAE